MPSPLHKNRTEQRRSLRLRTTRHFKLRPFPATHAVVLLSSVVAGAAFVTGCGSQAQGTAASPVVRRTPRPAAPLVPSPIKMVDVTARAGIGFRHNNGSFGLRLYPESMGGGVAFLDFDGDGWQDVFFVNGRDWTAEEVSAYERGMGRVHRAKFHFSPPALKKRARTTGRLYRNNGDGTFRDATKNSGLDLEMLGMGVAAGDYDNDGRADLYVTGYGRSFLFRNLGRGRFQEEAQAAGVRSDGFATGAAWVDYDRDGRLDLFVCHYIDWNPGNDIWAFGSTRKVNGAFLKGFAGPPYYNGEPSRLYRNLGRGRFSDVSRQAGIYAPTGALANPDAPQTRATEIPRSEFRPKTFADVAVERRAPRKHQGKALGVAVFDYNSDGWPDLLVTNDTVRNYLFANQKNGTFREVAIPTGVAFDPNGKSRAGMGVDTGDIDQSGRESVVIGNFTDEGMGLYQNGGGGAFSETARQAQVLGPSLRFLTFGCLFLDIDNDGWLDILAANGHVRDTIAQMERAQQHAQRPLLFINRGRQTQAAFDEVSLQSGPALSQPIVGRGLAYADFDLDGDADVLLTSNGSQPKLLRNDPAPGARRNNVVRLTLEGTRSNASAIGARAEAVVRAPGGPTPMRLRRTVKSGSSYLSQSELPLTLGIGAHLAIERLDIHWPSGAQTKLANIAANQSLRVREGKGIVSRLPLQRR